MYYLDHYYCLAAQWQLLSVFFLYLSHLLPPSLGRGKDTRRVSYPEAANQMLMSLCHRMRLPDLKVPSRHPCTGIWIVQACSLRFDHVATVDTDSSHGHAHGGGRGAVAALQLEARDSDGSGK